MEKILLTAKDIQQLTGFSLPTIYNWFHVDGFPVINVGRKKVVTKEAFSRWLDEQTAAPKQ